MEQLKKIEDMNPCVIDCKRYTNGVCVIEKDLIVRFHQCKDDNYTFIHIRFEKLKPNTKYSLHVHEYGGENLGDCYTTCLHPSDKIPFSFDTCSPDNIKTDLEGSCNVIIYEKINLKDIIGRSLLLTGDEIYSHGVIGHAE